MPLPTKGAIRALRSLVRVGGERTFFKHETKVMPELYSTLGWIKFDDDEQLTLVLTKKALRYHKRHLTPTS